MWMLLLLLFVVLAALLLPVKQKVIDYDEKSEAIKVYQDEVAHLERQFEKGFIDEDEKAQLLTELDKKSALAITRIEQRSFSYRRSLVPFVFVVLGLASVSLYYYWHYESAGISRWQGFNTKYQDKITEGLFDKKVVENFLLKSDPKTGSAYCFAMQQELLKNYDTNPDTLANLAQCHLMGGYPQLAKEAAERGLKTTPQHAELNYVLAEADFIENKVLSPDSLDRLLVTIKKDPTHFNALRLLAVNSLSQGDYKQARFFFSQLKKLSGDNPELLSALERMDNDIAKKMQGQLAANEAKNSNDTPSLKIAVKIAPDIAEKLTTPQTIFVVVKSVGGQLINANKLVINDANDMVELTIMDNLAGSMQQQSMADYQQFSITARISASGSPIASSGDYTSQPTEITLPQTTPTTLLIDTVVP